MYDSPVRCRLCSLWILTAKVYRYGPIGGPNEALKKVGETILRLAAWLRGLPQQRVRCQPEMNLRQCLAMLAKSISGSKWDQSLVPCCFAELQSLWKSCRLGAIRRRLRQIPRRRPCWDHVLEKFRSNTWSKRVASELQNSKNMHADHVTRRLSHLTWSECEWKLIARQTQGQQLGKGIGC